MPAVHEHSALACQEVCQASNSARGTRRGSPFKRNACILMLHENATRALMQNTGSGESGSPCYCGAERACAPPGALGNRASGVVTICSARLLPWATARCAHAWGQTSASPFQVWFCSSLLTGLWGNEISAVGGLARGAGFLGEKNRPNALFLSPSNVPASQTCWQSLRADDISQNIDKNRQALPPAIEKTHQLFPQGPSAPHSLFDHLHSRLFSIKTFM